MAAPPIPNEVIIDDDDEFDWEAAVREIDVACQGTEASTSRSGDSAHGFLHQNLVEKKLKNPATSRQSTLDKFVRKVDGGSVFENESHSHSAQDNIGGVETGFCTEINHEAAKTWIYPVNVPRRDYQFSITKTALFSNTLVALPTGLGKTLIAAVVMFNYFRWFPEGKVIEYHDFY
ncbi:hypothetical protein HHK36_009118 [Tetracentron sinense]|uniref:Uncharacterized protein n=1 Tax=Tetracentron sinense TaxID=13715 RepID=A0A835DI35_TETSI|nr:hypothetical protein HHK36_009118 [Tetracentron sinense]